MGQSTQDGDLYVNGVLTAKTFNPPNNAITRKEQIGTTGDPIEATKVQHRHIKSVALSDHATLAAVKRVVVHVVYGATATLKSFKAGATVAATSTGEAVVDLKVNGVSVLTSTITLDSSDIAFSQVVGSLASVDLVQNDVVEMSIDSVSSTVLPKGVHGTVVIDETPAT